jgi:RNA recognition motif-containing protein
MPNSPTEQKVDMNIYVGNLPFSTTSESLNALFSRFGSVSSASVATDRETGRSRGFGFVEMDDSEEAKRAIEELDGSDIDGRRVTVNVARPKTDRPRGGGDRRGGGGNYGNRQSSGNRGGRRRP